jgi:hypothetical protein
MAYLLADVRLELQRDEPRIWVAFRWGRRVVYDDGGDTGFIEVRRNRAWRRFEILFSW